MLDIICFMLAVRLVLSLLTICMIMEVGSLMEDIPDDKPAPAAEEAPLVIPPLRFIPLELIKLEI